MTAIEELLKVFKLAADVDDKRPVELETQRGTYLYNDGKKEYSPLLPELNRGISNVESLAGAVIEECVRRNNPTGNFMTVIFTEKGGAFYPDDERRLDRWTYERCLSQQWKFLLENLNKEMKHLDFIRFVQGLRPSVINYQALIREFKKVTFDGRTSVTSQPIIEDGQGGSQVSFTLETKNGHTQTAMPGDIAIELPFTRGSDKKYSLIIELDVALNEMDQVRFRPVCPELEVVTEQAIADEVAFFKEQVKEKSDLLVLLDY